MRIRKLDSNGDYQLNNWIENIPEVVAQICVSNLKLWQGTWFLNNQAGTPWLQAILGKNTNYDLQIQSVILSSPGVTEIVAYSSSVDNRVLSVEATIGTIYGITQISTTIQG